MVDIVKKVRAKEARLGVTLSRQQLHDDSGSRQCHAYAGAGEPAALANNIDHIIKSPPLMSSDAPVM